MKHPQNKESNAKRRKMQKKNDAQKRIKFKVNADTALLIKCDKRMYVFNLNGVLFFYEP